MRRSLPFLAFATLLALAPSHADACGGCFGPVGQATQVTAHRMAVMVGPSSTTLWDQFEYTGAPEDFVWVLPVAGEQDVQIELASNDFFTALQAATAIQLQAPWRSTGGGGGSSFFGCGAVTASAESGSGPMSRVTVYAESVVGPYETATIGSEDPDALVTWLRDNGYGVPSDMLPTITHYVDAGMNFVALRLAPDEGIDRMQPVRVTTPGINSAFPLRMVGAGVVDSVALELFILAEGRYEAANFDNLEVDREAIVYDYATESFDYDERARTLIEESAGGGWLTEVADAFSTWSLANQLTTDGAPIEAADDLAFVEAALGTSLFVTRMRADLPRDALRVDLQLQASTEPALPTFVQVLNDVNFGSTPSTSPLREAGGLPTGVLGLWMGIFALRRRFGR